MDTTSRSARLEALGRMVGTWTLQHCDLITGEKWTGKDTFAWIDDGQFLLFNHEEHGRVKGFMVIGFETRWGQNSPSREVLGHWFDSRTGEHFIYVWELIDDALTFWLEERGGDFAFNGNFSRDNNTINGHWTWPGGGYSLTMTRSNQPELEFPGTTNSYRSPTISTTNTSTNYETKD